MANVDSRLKTLTVKQLIIRCEDMSGCTDYGVEREKIIRWMNDILGEILTDSKPWWMEESATLTTTEAYNEDGAATASVTKNSPTVTFSGSNLVAGHVGMKFTVSGSGDYYTILSVDSPTQLTLDSNYIGETESSIGFWIAQDVYSLPSNFDSPKYFGPTWTSAGLTVTTKVPDTFAVGDDICRCEITVDRKLKLWPAPKSAMRIYYEYYRDYTIVQDLAATIALPDKFVNAICLGVARNWWMSSHTPGAIGKARDFMQMFEAAKIALRRDKNMDNAELVNLRSMTYLTDDGYY